MAEEFVGRSISRVEDQRLLTGRGRYVADVEESGALHACFLRSSQAHARISRIDVSAALAVPGVVSVLTGRDIAAVVSRLSSLHELPKLRRISFDAMPQDKVRFVGDLVALVVAESRYIAEDGCDAIEVDYEELPAVASSEDALRGDAPLVFEDLGREARPNGRTSPWPRPPACSAGR